MRRLYSLTGTGGDGALPNAGGTLEANADLFGTAYEGGTLAVGTMSEIAAGASTATTPYILTGTGADGALPFAGLTLANGDLFGTTVFGGTSGYGTVFEIPAGAPTATTLYSFTHTGADGAFSYAGATLDANMDLFGTTLFGGTSASGTAFEIAAGAPTAPTLYSFTRTGADGADPQSVVTFDAKGDLFGTTLNGGTSGDGTVFEIAAGASTATTLYSFGGTGAEAAHPEAGVTLDAKGDLFGTTAYGGAFNYGTVFEIAAGASTATTLYSFNNATGTGSDGAHPYAGVTLDAQGDLFGTTQQGGTYGSYGDGTVFELAAGASTVTTLYSFTGTDGATPYGGVTLDAKGDLFGTTAYGAQGAASGDGTVFEIAAGASTATTLHSFTGTGGDGANPYAGVTLDANGDLFGTTYAGGTSGYGTVFEIAAGATTATTLYSFTGTGADGAHPFGAVILDAHGDLFGTTGQGGTVGFGTVFEIAAGASTATTLYSFTAVGDDGLYPYAGVALDAHGDLFGTTQYGGTSDDGTVFELPSVICFYPGVLIMTQDGQRAVETLAIGDRVLTSEGAMRRVRWIGRQTISTRFADPLRALPIRIKAGALGENSPVRDLLLSPAHAIKVDEILVQAGALVNGGSIVREANVPETFVYYHVELDDHSLLLAEGVPAETFVDNASRENFDNWDEHLKLYPDGHENSEMPYPRAQAARQVPMAIKRRLALRSAEILEPRAQAA